MSTLSDLVQNLFANYKMLSLKGQLLVSLAALVLGIAILPNTLVYAIATLVSYRLVEVKRWKIAVVTLFSIFTFFSGILLLAGDEEHSQQIETFNAPTQEKKEIVPEDIIASTTDAVINPSAETAQLYDVVKVVDGDTIDVSIDGKIERVRLIGINTPETVDPRKPIECFGVEASTKAKELLSGKKISLEADSSQGERDKYDRLLRYVFLENGDNFNLKMIREGFAYEYTYDMPYKYQDAFKQAQKEAADSGAGLWGATCKTSTTTAVPVTNTVSSPVSTQSDSTVCSIKGNISSSGERIYHVVGCGSYTKTVIDESKGERWFCSEQEALDAGWRKALNCN